MSETGHHGSAQPAEQHGEDLLQEPGQEEAQVRTPARTQTHVRDGRAEGMSRNDNKNLMTDSRLLIFTCSSITNNQCQACRPHEDCSFTCSWQRVSLHP